MFSPRWRADIRVMHKRKPLPRYALFGEDGEYEFLVDTKALQGLSYITVRRGSKTCVVGGFDEGVTVEHSDFSEIETERIRKLAQRQQDDLAYFFLSIRNDWKLGRLRRNELVD